MNLTYKNKPHPLRASMVFLKRNTNGKALVGAEIGVSHGDNAFSILNRLNIKKLYLIDPWEPYVDYLGKVTHETGFEATKKKLKKWCDKIVIIRKLSNDAVADIKDPLDFVYIDGNHMYDFVLSDMENYYGLLKPGGLLAGHDLHCDGVLHAFHDFVNKNNIDGFYAGTRVYDKHADWWIVKP